MAEYAYHHDFDPVSREDALRMCPVLGSLATEHAEAMLELAVIAQKTENMSDEDIDKFIANLSDPISKPEKPSTESIEAVLSTPLTPKAIVAEPVAEQYRADQEAQNSEVNSPEQITHAIKETKLAREVISISEEPRVSEEPSPKPFIDVAAEVADNPNIEVIVDDSMIEAVQPTPSEVITPKPEITTKVLVPENTEYEPEPVEVIDTALVKEPANQIEAEWPALVPVEQFELVSTTDQQVGYEDEVTYGLVDAEMVQEKPKIFTSEIVQKATDYIETAEPDDAVVVEGLMIFIDTAVQRLEVLAKDEKLDTNEAIEIITMITEMYEELVTALHLPDTESAEEFINRIIQTARAEQIDERESSSDEGTHEIKHGIFTMARYLSEDAEAALLSLRVGRFTLQAVTAS